MPDWRVFSLFRQHMQLNRIKIWTWHNWTLHATPGLQNCMVNSWVVFLWKSMKMESFLLIENSTSLIVIIKISDLHNAYTDCVPSWTANYIRNSGDDYSTKRKNAVWSCGSSMNCKIRAMHFLPWSTRLVKKSLIGQRKDYIFIFIPLNLNLISLSKNVQPFNSYFPHLNPMPAFILDLSSLTCPITHLAPQKYVTQLCL